MATRRRPGDGRERGFALLIVLWTLVLFSLLVSAITASGGGRAREAAAFSRNTELQACAEGGVDQALFHVLDQSAARWLADGQARKLAGQGCDLRVAVTSQDGKINPNVASQALLTGLLLAAGADAHTAPQIAAALVAWRFPTGQPVSLPGRDYRAPGAPFESIDELALVPGMTPTLLRRMAPDLSLYHDGDPNLADADPLVRRAVILATSADQDQDQGGAEGGGGENEAQTAPGNNSGAHDRFNPATVQVDVDATGKAGERVRIRVIALTGSAAGRDQTGRPIPSKIVDWSLS